MLVRPMSAVSRFGDIAHVSTLAVVAGVSIGKSRAIYLRNNQLSIDVSKLQELIVSLRSDADNPEQWTIQ